MENYLKYFTNVSLKTSPEQGRLLVASKEISQGDTIFEEHASLAGVDELNIYVCLACGCCHHTSKNQFQPPCDVFAIFLKEYEQAIASVGKIHEETGMDIARIQMTLQFLFQSLQLQQLNAIAAHNDRLPQTSSELVDLVLSLEYNTKSEVAQHAYPSVVLCAAKLNSLLPECCISLWTSEKIAVLLGLIDTNAHQLIYSLQDQEHKKADDTPAELYGSGIFVAGAMVNHSCYGNTRFSTVYDEDKGSVILRMHAFKDIKKSEPLTICYQGFSYLPTQQRKLLLQKRYGFDCSCNRCSSNTDRCRAFECFQCEDGIIYPTFTQTSARDQKEKFDNNSTKEDPGFLSPKHVWQCNICMFELDAGLVGECERLEQEFQFVDAEHPYNQDVCFIDFAASSDSRCMKFHESHYLYWNSLNDLLMSGSQNKPGSKTVGMFLESHDTKQIMRALLYLCRCLDHVLVGAYAQHPFKLKYWSLLPKVSRKSLKVDFDFCVTAYNRMINIGLCCFGENSVEVIEWERELAIVKVLGRE